MTVLGGHLDPASLHCFHSECQKRKGWRYDDLHITRQAGLCSDQGRDQILGPGPILVHLPISSNDRTHPAKIAASSGRRRSEPGRYQQPSSELPSLAMSASHKLLVAFLLFTSIAASVWALTERRKNERMNDAFFERTYDLPRDLVITRWKHSGGLVDVGVDRNGDRSDDSVIVYGSNDRIAAIWVDEDYNGLLEVQYIYSNSGLLISKYEDLGQDGSYEEFIHYTMDSALTYRDANNDGYFAPNERVRSEVRNAP
jgi:hypothetical protein